MGSTYVVTHIPFISVPSHPSGSLVYLNITHIAAFGTIYKSDPERCWVEMVGSSDRDGFHELDIDVPAFIERLAAANAAVVPA